MYIKSSFLILLSILFTLTSCVTDESYPTSFEQKSMTSIDNMKAGDDYPILKIETGGHSDQILDICFSSTGDFLISVSTDKTIRMWNLKTNRLQSVFRGHIGDDSAGSYLASDLSPDDSLLAVGVMYPEGAAIRLLDIPSGEILTTLRGHKAERLEALDFSPDGRYLASSSDDGEVIIWDIKKREEIQRFTAWRRENRDRNVISDIEFTPDGKQIAVGCENGWLTLWSAPEGHLLYELEAHDLMVTSISFSEDGQKLLTTGFDGNARLWDFTNKTMIREIEQQGDLSIYLKAGALTQDGKHAFVGRVDTSRRHGSEVSIIRMYDTASGMLEKDMYHPRWNGPKKIVISPDGRYIAGAISWEISSIVVWDLESGKLINDFKSESKAVIRNQFSADGKALLWGANERNYENSFTIAKGGEEKSMIFQVSPFYGGTDKRTLKSAGDYSIEPYVEVRSETRLLVKNKGNIHNRLVSDVGGGFTDYEISPDGMEIYAGTITGAIRAYDSGTGEILREYKGNTGWIHSLSISPDGRYILSGSGDQTQKIWNRKTGELLVSLFVSNDKQWACWTPQGYYASSSDGDQYVGWQVNTGMDTQADYYSARQFRRFLHRPDIVENTLISASAIKAIEDAGMSEITVSALIKRAPVGIEIVKIEDVPDSNSFIHIRLKENATTTPERITIFVNGSQVLKQEERILTDVQPGEILTRELDFLEEDNKITVVVENEWAESFDEITHTQTAFFNSGSKGDLYYLGVGISHYPLLPEDRQLQTPVLDVFSMGNILRDMEGSLYEKAHVLNLTDENNTITTMDVQDFFNNEDVSPGPEDTVVIFLAGHGKTDFQGNYHLITADTDLKGLDNEQDERISNSFTWKDLHNSLDQYRGKKIVIVDTCEAGSVLKKSTINLNKLEKDIHDVHAVIFSGSSYQEAGVETSEGGLFTQAIISSIQNKDNYIGNNMTMVTLGDSVKNLLPEMTKGILREQYRGLKKLDQENSGMDALSSILENVQTPTLLLPEDMKEFTFYTLEK